MANPPVAGINGVGSVVSSGYPVFGSKDGNGTIVTPMGVYVWNGTAWVPAPTDANGNPLVGIRSSVGVEPAIGPDGDGQASTNGLVIIPRQELFNESTWDRQRNNTQGTLLASAARTAQIQTSLQTNYNARGVVLVLNISASTYGTNPSLGIYIVHQSATGWASYLGEVSISSPPTGVHTLIMYPGTSVPTLGSLDGFVRAAISAPLPRQWYVLITLTNITSITFGLDSALIL